MDRKDFGQLTYVNDATARNYANGVCQGQIGAAAENQEGGL